MEVAAGDARDPALKKILLVVSLSSSAVGASKKTPLAAPISIPFQPVRQLVMLDFTSTAHVSGHVTGSRQRLSFVLGTGDKYAIIDMARARELNLAFGHEMNAPSQSVRCPAGVSAGDRSRWLRSQEVPNQRNARGFGSGGPTSLTR